MVVIICVCAAIVAISLIIGLVKGYSRTKTWTTEYFFAAFFSVLIFSIANVENNTAKACLALGIAIVLLLLFAFTSKQIRSYFNKKTAAARKRYYYESYGEREEHFLEIIDALELNDKKAYERLTSRKMREKSGGAGVADRICGGLNLAFKAAVICTLTIVVTLLVLHFTQLPIVLEGGSLYGVYTSGVWQFISPYIFDFILVGILQFAIRAGYRAGIINSLWVLFVIALVIGCGYVSYYLAFKTEIFSSVIEKFAGFSFIASAGDAISSIISSFTAYTLAKLIIKVLMLIVVFIII